MSSLGEYEKGKKDNIINSLNGHVILSPRKGFMNDNEKKWQLYKATLDGLKDNHIISLTIYYLMIVNIREKLKLPIEK